MVEKKQNNNNMRAEAGKESGRAVLRTSLAARNPVTCDLWNVGQSAKGCVVTLPVTWRGTGGRESQTFARGSNPHWQLLAREGEREKVKVKRMGSGERSRKKTKLAGKRGNASLVECGVCQGLCRANELRRW